jgi:hypothetical protein
MDDDKIDYDMLLKKSLECRQYAEEAESLQEQKRWIKMADKLLAIAQEYED